MKKEFTYAFKDEVLQERTTNLLNDYLKPYPNIEFNSPISYLQAKSIVYGKYGDILITNIDNHFDNTINFDKYRTGADSQELRSHYNPFSLMHEKYFDKHAEEVGQYNLQKFINAIEKINNALRKYDYQYNIVYYTKAYK